MKKPVTVITAATFAAAAIGFLTMPVATADPSSGCQDPSFPRFNVCTGMYNDGTASAFPRGPHGDGSGNHSLPPYGSRG